MDVYKKLQRAEEVLAEIVDMDDAVGMRILARSYFEWKKCSTKGCCAYGQDKASGCGCENDR